MKKGYYQFIQPANLITANPNHFVFVVAIFNWLIPLLYEELGKELLNTEMEVVRFEFRQGSQYPALAILYKEEGLKDLETLVEATIEKILNERPAISLISAILRDDISWIVEAKRIMGREFIK
jgi:hypothetical protein